MTRPLTEQEQEQLASRRAAFTDVMEQLGPAITELADHLGLPFPERAVDRLDEVLQELDRTLPRLDLEALSNEQLVWLNTRLLYFIGQWLVRRYSGHWFLQEDPESDFFLRYITGNFQDSPDPTIIIDPLEVAIHVLEDPSARPLSVVLNTVFTNIPPEDA